jgi:hypothetical protein
MKAALAGQARKPMAKPINTEVMNAPIYDGAEMRPYQGRPGATDALKLPSRMGDRLHYRDGRVTPV